MLGALGLAAALFLLAAPAASGATGPSGKLASGAEETALRLHDLPPGYRIGDDSGCDAVFPADGAPKPVWRWITRNWPEVCGFDYERRFRVPGLGPAPPLVVTTNINTLSEEGAAEGFELLAPTAPASSRQRFRGTVSIGPAGPLGRLYRFEDDVLGEPRPASMLLWHHGSLIALVEAAGMRPRDNDRAALHYAQVQQGRLEAPSPYTEAEQDDSEVVLDDPALRYPTYWVGKPFKGGGGLPSAELEYVFGRGEGPPGQKFEFEYDEFHINGWTRASWKRFQGSVLGRLNLKRACVRTTGVDLEHGRAVVYAGYGQRDLDRCPHHPPDDYWAIAHIGRMVVGVNLTTCTGCVRPGSGPDNSLRGMKTLLRSLEVRPKPDYG